MPQQFGLTFQDEAQWQDWANSGRRLENALREVKAKVKPASDAPVTLHLPSGTAKTLVVVDKLTPSCRFAIGDPIEHFDPTTTAVLAYADADLGLLERDALPYTGVDMLPATITRVLSLGSYVALSAPVAQWARDGGRQFFVVQHGLLTPWSPPAPRDAHVLVWNEADAEFWTHGRADMAATVVGSQMLWDAAAAPKLSVGDDRPIMLGQLHGAELSRRSTFGAYWDFCRRVPSDYRPHPNESDVVSRALHEVMKRGGISFETSGRPLTELGRPVVSIFSTGTLEAAQRGLPAWVTHPKPDAWVRNFWERYGLAQWGTDPTKPWANPTMEPARAVAAAVEEA